jgi:hypothetical protein
VEEHIPVKLTTSHPQIDEDGTIWNIGTSYEPKKGYSYSVIKYQKRNPDWTGRRSCKNAKCQHPVGILLDNASLVLSKKSGFASIQDEFWAEPTQTMQLQICVISSLLSWELQIHSFTCQY